MVDGDNGSSSPGEEQIPCPDPQHGTDTAAAPVAAAEGDRAVESLAHRIQEAVAVGMRHRFWETQPVGQFKDAGDTSLSEGPIEPPAPLSAVKPEPYNLPALYEKMELRDVPAVTRLLREYLSQHVVAPDLDENDVEHWLLPLENVVESFVVESPETHEVTDFFSFYSLPSSILNNQNYSVLKAAYSYYNVAKKTPLLQLMNDALTVAKQKDYDVFNALDAMHNETFLKELKFGPGDGQLHYYLYNYRVRNALRPSELGLVLL
ncbi:hypothetical protein C4D60_Mb04t25620 [Musa balbisiana]|uniref:Glycylpeptide N-tetradecanoyltransferase n=1 Tax=Musa balbisiana TaxID=52838 RepID=A0A4S8KER3_MUSBA|nr:hypothetical protein C4D60_Mb04t25620 [Musa balbisiana]